MIIQGAVITADIVNSTALGTEQVKDLAERLKDLIQANKAKFLSFYRGDSFQCYLVDPYSAFRLGLKLRALTRGFGGEIPGVERDLKISIGIGGIDSPVININSAMGEAFILSGRGLDELTRPGRRFLLRSGNMDINLALEVISRFTDYLFGRLTTRQAEVLQYLLEERTQQDTARILNKSQSTINRHVQALGWEEMEHLLEIYQQCIHQITGSHG